MFAYSVVTMLLIGGFFLAGICLRYSMHTDAQDGAFGYAVTAVIILGCTLFAVGEIVSAFREVFQR